MSDDNFLARWSRRKREVAKSEAQEPQPAPETVWEPDAADVPPQPASPEPQTDEVDLSSLPSLESITGSTDITGFLRSGVPDDLARSALRRAWTSDPAIRDFVGIAENQWDFNDPASIPGFGALDFASEQVRQMAAKLVGDVREIVANEQPLASAAPQHRTDDHATDDVHADVEPAELAEPDVASCENINIASQQEEQNSRLEIAKPRRHGGALPR